MQERTRAIRALVQLEEAAVNLRQVLRGKDQDIRRIRRQLERGTPISDALVSGNVAQLRREIDQALKRFEQARRGFRVASLALGLSEGKTASDLARLWGVSRQRAAQLAKDLDGRPFQGDL